MRSLSRSWRRSATSSSRNPPRPDSSPCCNAPSPRGLVTGLPSAGLPQGSCPALAGVIGLVAKRGLALVLGAWTPRSGRANRLRNDSATRYSPRSRRSADQRRIVTADHPTSAARMRSDCWSGRARAAARPGDAEDGEEEVRGRIVLITSSGPAEGEAGRQRTWPPCSPRREARVIVFSADLRRPTLHAVLDSACNPARKHPVSDHLASGIPAMDALRSRLPRAERWTRRSPREVLAPPSRRSCDVATEAAEVIVDTAPILVAANPLRSSGKQIWCSSSRAWIIEPGRGATRRPSSPARCRDGMDRPERRCEDAVPAGYRGIRPTPSAACGPRSAANSPTDRRRGFPFWRWHSRGAYRLASERSSSVPDVGDVIRGR